MNLEIFTLRQRPDYEDRVDELNDASWPEFIRKGGDVNNWGRLFDDFADYQLLLCEAASGELLAVGHTVPLVWDGTHDDLPDTIRGIVRRASEAREKGQKPNTVSALAAMVSPRHRRLGLSGQVIRQMRQLAAGLGCDTLIAPVRPTLKVQYPLTAMERYIQWTNEGGEMFDPWMRVHERLGATIMKVAGNTLTVEGTLAEWEGWAGMAFPDSGAYVVPGALQPVIIDRATDRGRYEDPNVWMRHPVRGEA